MRDLIGMFTTVFTIAVDATFYILQSYDDLYHPFDEGCLM